LASALWCLADRPQVTGILHFTDAGVASWFDVAATVLETLQSAGRLPEGASVVPIATADYPMPARRPPYSVLDKHDSWQSIGLRPAALAERCRRVHPGALECVSCWSRVARDSSAGTSCIIGCASTRLIDWSCSTRSPMPAISQHCRHSMAMSAFVSSAGDVADRDVVERTIRENGIETVVHFAAESHVDRSIVEPGAFVRTNVVGTQVLLDAARSAWRDADRWRPVRALPHVSTDEVYGSLGPKRSGVQRADAVFTELAVRGEQGGVRPPRACVSPYLWNTGIDQQLLQQLRPVPVSGKADSAHDRERTQGSRAAGV
jgi:hypothetical protein